jgi:CRISPR/Cas system CSM-associated protein Csm3 (group 7 of RAMP superfamily)
MTVPVAEAPAENPQLDGGEAGGRSRSVSYVAFVLTLTEPGGVSVPGPAGADVHALLDRGHDGRPQVPGTSLAGALRDMVRAARGDEVACRWFGRLLGEEDERADGRVAAEASPIWVFGGRLREPADPFAMASTAIDRFRGAARAQALRADEVLLAGTSFEAFLRWDDAPDDEVLDLAELLAGWRPLIGRGVSRGRGQCSVSSVRHGTLHLDSPDDLRRWLTLSGPELARAVAVTAVSGAAAGGEPQICRVPVSIAGPWRIGTGEKIKGSPAPMLRISGELTVPGSAIKGVVRSRSEFIVRSVGMDVCTDQQCGSCWACRVFGHGGGSDGSSPAVGARALVRFADCPLRDCGEVVTRTHVAIDRFTGGARDKLLYQDEVVESGSFTVLVSRLETVPPPLLTEIRAVLRLVLEDLDDGVIGMGSGSARGYGSVRVKFGSADGDSSAGGLPSAGEARRELGRMARDGAHAG